MDAKELFNTLTDEEKERFEKSADLLLDIFGKNVEIGDATSHRLILSMLSNNDEDREYYSMVLKQCNNIIAMMCRVLDIPEPKEEEE